MGCFFLAESRATGHSGIMYVIRWCSVLALAEAMCDLVLVLGFCQLSKAGGIALPLAGGRT